MRRPTATRLAIRSAHPTSAAERAGGHVAGRLSATLAGLALAFGLIATDGAAAEASEAEAVHPCEAGATLATGRPDPAVFSFEASRGVRAFWCETYDEQGMSHRAGAYWDLHPHGSTRVRARYVHSRIDGTVEVFSEDGGIWLRGQLDGGAWSGPLELFHPNGSRWISAQFRAGELDGRVQTWFPDGSLESETRFQAGREDGIASSYFPAVAGGGLRSRVRIEADQIVDRRPQDEPTPPEALSARAAPEPLAQRVPSVAAGASGSAIDASLP